MIEIIIDNSRAKIKTSEIEVFVEEPFEIKKGAEAPIIILKDNQQ